MPRTPTSRLAAKAGVAPSDHAPIALETLEPRIVLAATADAFHSTQYVHFDNASSLVDIAVGDLNGDGMDDIAAVDGNDLYVLQSFKGAYRLSHETFDLNNATRVEMADLTGNGLLDIAVLANSAAEMRVLINGGAGNLAAPVLSQPGLIAVTDWAFVDLNADGRADPILLSASRVRAYDTIADGTAPSGSPLFEETSIGTANTHLAVGDIDRDGILDVAFIGTNDTSLYIKRGTGGGAAASAVTINTITTAIHKGLELIDASGNGDVEHVVAIQQGGLARSLVNTSTPGSFSVGVNGNNVTNTDGSGNSAVGDITGDGIADLILTGDSEDAYAILFGDPSAQDESDYFDNASQYDPDENIQGVRLGDANGDRRLDIFGFVDSSVIIHANLGNAVFTMPEVSLGGTSGSLERPNRAIYGDFDGDGQTDAVVFTSDDTTDNDFRVKFGTKGRFGTDNLDIGTGFSNVLLEGIAVDTDGDGDLDLVFFGNDGSRNQVQVFRNDGNRSFTSFNVGNIAGNTFDINRIWAGNLNAGTKQDIVLADADNDRIVILTGLGTGNVTLIDRVRLGTDIFDIAVADMDADGDNDIVMATAGGVSILVEEGNFLYESLRTRLIGGGAKAVAVGNFNPGNAPDVAAIAGDGYGEFMFFRNDSTTPDQPFLRPITNTAFTLGREEYDTITVGDLDNDGTPDFVLTHSAAFQSNTDAIFTVLEGDGFLGVSSAGFFEFDSSFDDIRSPGLADLDNDGDLDLMVVSNLQVLDRDGVAILRNYGDGTFVLPDVGGGAIETTRVPLPSIGSNESPTVTGDFNADGLLDIAVLERPFSSGTTLQVSINLNNGEGFTRVAVIDIASVDDFETDDELLVAGDVNGDGRDDLVLFNNRFDDLRHYTLLNTSPAGNTFSLFQSYSQSDFNYDATTLADLNSDGILDIVAVSHSGNNIVIMPGRGDGTFRNGAVRITLMDIELLPSSTITTLDADGDGLTDFITTRNGIFGRELRLYRQTSPGVFGIATLLSTNDDDMSMWPGVADLNNDSRPDIFLTTRDASDHRLVILFNTSTPGSPSFSDLDFAMPEAAPGGGGAVAADIDSDGRLELLVYGDFESTRIFELNAAGVPIATAGLGLVIGDEGPTRFADADGDGDLDWFASHAIYDSVAAAGVFANRTNGPSRVSNVAPAIPGGSIFLAPQTLGSSTVLTYEDFLALSGVTDADGDEVRFRIVNIANGSLSGPGGIINGNNTFRPGTSITYTAPMAGGASVVAFRVTLSDPFGESSVVIPVRVPLVSPLTAPPTPPPAPTPDTSPDTSPGWLDFDPLDLAFTDEDTIALMAGV